MNLNGQVVLPTIHKTRDEQEVRTFLESINEEVVKVDVTPYQVLDNVVEYLVVVYTKVT